MSSYSDYANAASDIITHKGDALARAKSQNGQLIGSTIATLGSQIPQQVQDAIAKRAEQRKQQQIQSIFQQSGGDLDAAIPEVMKLDPALGEKLSEQQLAIKKHALEFQKLDWEYKKAKADANDRLLGQVHDEDSYAVYALGRKQAGDTDGLIDHYDPDWVRQQKIAHLSFKEQLDLENPTKKPESLVPIPGPDGKPIYGTPTAGQPVYEKPPSQGAAPNVGSFEDYVVRKYGDKPTPGQITEARKTYMQSDDRPPSVHVSVNGGVGTLDPGGLELAATDYRLTHRLPARNAEQNGAIISAAAAQGKALGNSPVATIQKQAAYAGDSKALAKMQGMAASAEAFESKAIAQTDIIADLSSKVPRTSFPLINAALQSGRTNITGDANATKLANAIETFTEEYAKVMNGSTGSSAASSDSSRAAAKRLISTAMSKGTMTQVIDLMKREMDLTMQGYGSVINHITERMGGSGTPAPGAPAPAAPASAPSTGGLTYQDYLKSKGGK